MSPLLRHFLALLLALSLPGLAGAQEKPFAHAGVQADAKRYESYLRSSWQPKGEGRTLRAEGARILAAGNDPRAASRAYAQAVVFDAGDTEAWTGLARALLADAPVLLLDEPTAHLDPQTAEELVRDVLGGAAGRTVLLVTHRPEGLDLVDEVVRLGTSPDRHDAAAPGRP